MGEYIRKCPLSLVCVKTTDNCNKSYSLLQVSRQLNNVYSAAIFLFMGIPID